MSSHYDLHVETSGGVYDLGRVVSVLALYEITPTTLTSQASAQGLVIAMRIAADPRRSSLCLAKLQALVSVTWAELAQVSTYPPSGNRNASA
jgi:hypothetical protein